MKQKLKHILKRIETLRVDNYAGQSIERTDEDLKVIMDDFEEIINNL
jgi:hypothetical protein